MKLIIGYMPAFGVGVMDRDYMYCIFLIYQLVDSFRRHPVAGVQFSLEAPQGMALLDYTDTCTWIIRIYKHTHRQFVPNAMSRAGARTHLLYRRPATSAVPSPARHPRRRRPQPRGRPVHASPPSPPLCAIFVGPLQPPRRHPLGHPGPYRQINGPYAKQWTRPQWFRPCLLVSI